MILTIKRHARENGSFWGVRLVVLGLWWGPEGSEMWEFPFPQVNELGLSKKKCLVCEFKLALHDFNLVINVIFIVLFVNIHKSD